MNTEPEPILAPDLDDYTRLESKYRNLQHEAYAYKRQRDKLAEALVKVLQSAQSVITELRDETRDP